MKVPPEDICAGGDTILQEVSGRSEVWEMVSVVRQHLYSDMMGGSSPMAQSPSFAAVRSTSPCPSSSHTMSSLAMLEMSPSISLHLPLGFSLLKFRKRFRRLTHTFRGRSFGAGVQMKSALPKHHSTSWFGGHGKLTQRSLENCSSPSFSITKAMLGLFLFPFVLSI